MKRKTVAVIIIAVGVLLAAVLLRGPLSAWFLGTGGEDASKTSAKSGSADGGAGAPAVQLSARSQEALKLAFSGYEQIRAELARDVLDGVSEQATGMATVLRDVAGSEPQLPSGLKTELTRAAGAADKLAKEQDVEAARNLFGDVSRAMVALAQTVPSLAEGWTAFECPMAQGYKRWLQPDAQMANPYMGTRMLKCGTTVDLAAEAHAAHGEGDPSEIAWYTCPMHPSVHQATMGKCPICGMDLTPVTRGDLKTGTVTVDDIRRQKIGVRIEPVTRSPLTVEVRTVGEVKYDETRLQDVSVKVRGWIRGLRVDATGQPVKKGEVLFGLYSPELFAAQQEFLLALKARGGDRDDPLVRASMQRLRLWDIGEAAIAELLRRGEPMEALPFRAPSSGFVIEKNVVEGASVEPGMRLYRIAALDRVWVEAQLYESELPFAKKGMPVKVRIPTSKDEPLSGRISYVYPYLQGETRTGLVRIELENAQGLLMPAMYVDVLFHIDRGERLQVPASAIIYTGPRRLVFVDLGEGRLRPREVKLGLRSGRSWEVLEGLKEGERVVTSGNFLIAAESRLRSATEYWGGEQTTEASHGAH